MESKQENPSNQTPDRAVALFRDASKRKAERPATPPNYARKAALATGGLLGLAYGLATQFCNVLVAPSIPYTHYPFGIVGNIVASVVGFTLICWVASLPKDSARGALFGALAAVAVLELRALIISSPMIGAYGSPYSFYGLVGIFIELAAAFPIMLIFRWMIAIQADHFDKRVWSWPRVALPLLFLLAAVGLGFFSLYPVDVSTAMLDTNALIKQGLTSSTPSNLPPALQSENGVQGFLSNALRAYTLELGEYEVLPEDPTAGTPATYTITIIARFKQGYTISCKYEDRLENPVCQSHGPADAPPITDFRAAVPP